MPPEMTREEPQPVADETTALTQWLDFQRATLLWKCEGLDGSQLARHSVPPSGLSLLGLVRHMLLVEWWWFDHIFAGGASLAPIPTDEDPDAEFNDLNPDQAEEALAMFATQCDVSRAIVAAAESLDALSVSDERETKDLRWVLIHMIEEYARHNGHADLLRECIDGVVGD